MAKWAYSEKPPIQKYLYLQCDCEDSEYGPMRGWSPEGFMTRLEKSRYVYVPRERGMSVCLNGQYEIPTLTRDRGGIREHKVLATIGGGMETEWVCKHCIATARYIGRRMWNARHLYVHLPDDPLVIERYGWAKYQAGELEVKTMRLTRHVCVTGWGYYDYGSNLFGNQIKEPSSS